MLENKNEQILQAKKKNYWLWFGIIGTIIIVVLIILLRRNDNLIKFNNPSAEESANKKNNSAVLTIPSQILANKFGFLGGGADDDGSIIVEYGAAWVRPHPGPFLWDAMQQKADSEIDFEESDELVQAFTETNLSILATLWPFADWDQNKLDSAALCLVSSNDEFLPRNDKKDRGLYLPRYRCRPADWSAYQNWIKKVVERYDGDGLNDMVNLKIPIKYWEVMNEPDLTSPEPQPRLDFWRGNASDYAELLIKTNQAIKEADPEAKVLIAGAAGGEEQFINFYREVFKNSQSQSAFDIGNVHCISNDRSTRDFNIGVYKNMLAEFNINKPIWITEAEAMYGRSAEENFANTKTSTNRAIAAGAERIFFTRYQFDDLRTEMSPKNQFGSFPGSQKYKELIDAINGS